MAQAEQGPNRDSSRGGSRSSWAAGRCKQSALAGRDPTSPIPWWEPVGLSIPGRPGDVRPPVVRAERGRGRDSAVDKPMTESVTGGVWCKWDVIFRDRAVEPGDTYERLSPKERSRTWKLWSALVSERHWHVKKSGGAQKVSKQHRHKGRMSPQRSEWRICSAYVGWVEGCHVMEVQWQGLKNLGLC